MEWSCISFPIHFYERALRFHFEIVWPDTQYAIDRRFLFSITPEHAVTVCDAIERVKTAWVELNCALKASCGLFPASLTLLDRTHHREYRGIIWQGPSCNFQFSQSAIVIEVSVIKMLCSRTVCFAGIWTDAKCFPKGCFR